MFRLFLISSVSLFAVLGFAAAPPAKRAVPADQVNLVFFAEDRPILLRLHALIGSRSCEEVDKLGFARFFDWFDLNGDGFLSTEEAKRLHTRDTFRRMLGSGFIANSPMTRPAFDSLDRNKDGRIDPQEFRSLYSDIWFNRNQYSPMTFNPVDVTDADTAELFTRLGAKDRLSRKILARLPQSFGQWDQNDDELISLEEVFPNPIPRPEQTDDGYKEDYKRIGMFQLDRQTSDRVVAVEMLRHYDRDQNARLSIGEFPLPAERFARVDANRDGVLDVNELRGLLQTMREHPDFVFRVHAGRVGLIPTTIPALGENKPIRPQRIVSLQADKRIREIDPGLSMIQLGRTQIHVRCAHVPDPEIAQTFPRMQAAFVELAGNNSFVTLAQVKASEFRDLLDVFPWADRNSDDKLAYAELEGWFSALGGPDRANLLVRVDDHGRSLFRALDANGDNDLSPRELTAAGQRLSTWSNHPDGPSQKELPRLLEITITQGPIANYPSFFRGVKVGPTHKKLTPPAWFTKMDRNEDGDVSEKEWLGDRELFRKLDRDGDGLISIEEALAR